MRKGVERTSTSELWWRGEHKVVFANAPERARHYIQPSRGNLGPSRKDRTSLRSAEASESRRDRAGDRISVGHCPAIESRGWVGDAAESQGSRRHVGAPATA